MFCEDKRLMRKARPSENQKCCVFASVCFNESVCLWLSGRESEVECLGLAGIVAKLDYFLRAYEYIIWYCQPVGLYKQAVKCLRMDRSYTFYPLKILGGVFCVWYSVPGIWACLHYVTGQTMPHWLILCNMTLNKIGEYDWNLSAMCWKWDVFGGMFVIFIILRYIFFLSLLEIMKYLPSYSASLSLLFHLRHIYWRFDDSSFAQVAFTCT